MDRQSVPRPILAAPDDLQPHQFVRISCIALKGNAANYAREPRSYCPLSSTRRSKKAPQGGSSHGHRQRRRGDHRRRPRRDLQAQRSRAASAEGEEREGAVQLLQGRQERGPRERQGRGRVAAGGGGRGGRVGGARAGARGRAHVDGGHRAQPGAQQQPAGVDPAGGLRPHLVPLHRLHLGPRRGRGVRRPLPLGICRCPPRLVTIDLLDVNMVAARSWV